MSALKKLWFLIITLLFFIFVANVNKVHADAAPALPNCTGNTGYSSQITKPTCGLIRINYKINLGQYEDKFVLLDHTGMIETVNPDDLYVLVQGDAILDNADKSSLDTNSYIAVDKTYFTAQGGLDGIFQTINHKSQYGNFYYKVMTPINQTDFSSHTYNFVVSKDDLLNSGNSTQANKFINISDISRWNIATYTTTSHLECGINRETTTCKKDVIYTPQSISGKNIILAESKITYQPANIAGSEVPFNYSYTNAFPPPEGWTKYFKEFIFWFIVTFISETLIILLILKKISKEKKLTSKKIIKISLLANAITVPFVWFVFPFLLNNTVGFLLSEIFAFVVEALIYKKLLKISTKKAFLISFIANLFSCVLGLMGGSLLFPN